VVSRGERDVVSGSVLRVWSGDEVVGGAFVVGPGLVATCAHVVADAAGGDSYDQRPPAGPVSMDLPLVAGALPGRLEAVVQRWVPIRPDGSGDVAILRVAAGLPAGARMPPLRRIERLWDHAFRVLGFPDGAWDGVWATGRIRGQQGTGWFQLQTTPGDQRIVGGFSGSPVWDEESSAVVGMTVAADRGATTTAYVVPIDQVLGSDPELLPCPYRGLAPFREEHAEMFFGRDDDVTRLLDAVGRLPVVAVAGPSGAGKSSLVRAGLLPRLRAEGARIADIRPVPGVAVALPEPAPGQVLVLDQFEEFAAIDPVAGRELLTRIVHRNGTDRAVLTVRWSALEELLTPELAGMLETGTVLVAPLHRPQLREVIVGPAERAPGLAFEEGLVDRILDDAGAEPGQLPLVESLLADLWERREGGYLTHAGYVAAGGVAGAVAQHADRVVADVPQPAADRMRRLFTLMAQPDGHGRFVRRPVALAAIPAELRELVPQLTRGRLLVVSADGPGSGVVELAHQALIEHWPRLRDWLVEDREFLAWRAQLGAQRERWEATARDDGALLRGTALAAAGGWLPARTVEVAEADREYVHRSVLRQRREVRWWRLVTTVVTVLALAAGVLAVVAVRRSDELAARLAVADADVLGRESINRASTDAGFSALLALAAWRADPGGSVVRTALGKSYLALQSTDAVFTDLLDVEQPLFVVGGDTMVTTSGAGLAVVTGLAGPAPQRRELPDASADRPAGLSPDGRWLADLGHDGAVRVRDLTGPAEPRTLPGASRKARGDELLRFSPDSTRLLRFDPDAPGGPDLQIFDRQSGAAVPHALGVLPADTAAVSLTPDPDLVLVRYGVPTMPASRLVLRSLADGAEVATLPPGSAIARAGAATVSCEDGDPADPARASPTLVVNPIGGAAPPLRIRGIGARCGKMEITSDGGAVVEEFLGSLDRDQQLLRLVDLSDGKSFQVTVPRTPAQAVSTTDFTLSDRMAIVPGTTDRPALLAAHGPSVLRLRTDPVAAGPGEPPIRYLAGGEYLTFDPPPGAGFTVEDRATTEVLGALPVLGEEGKLLVEDAFWTLDRPVGGAWELVRHEFPALRPVASYTLPTDPEDGSPHDAAVDDPDAGGPLVTLSDGVLSARDPGTGRPLGPPVRLGATEQERQWHRRAAVLWTRPAHRGQVVVLDRTGSLQVWDAVAGRLLGTIPTTVDGDGRVAIDPTGAQLAALTRAGTVESWDVDTTTALRAPIPMPGAKSIVGFDADGYLDVLAGNYGDERLTFLDLESGREAGSVLPGASIVGSVTGDPVVEVRGTGGALPFEIPVSARTWFERLCAVVNRPFTPAELPILPPGTATGSPCH
jgi:hypothetical protein